MKYSMELVDDVGCPDVNRVREMLLQAYPCAGVMRCIQRATYASCGLVSLPLS
jgi:hypothetical protein